MLFLAKPVRLATGAIAQPYLPAQGRPHRLAFRAAPKALGTSPGLVVAPQWPAHPTHREAPRARRAAPARLEKTANFAVLTMLGHGPSPRNV